MERYLCHHSVMASSIPPRRRFLRLLFGGSLLAVVAPAVYAITRFLSPLPGRAISLAAGNVSALAGGPKQIRVGTTDALLMRDGDAVIAFDLKCTHAGCTVAWEESQQLFRCPCHGGLYDARGIVKDGPPPLPLRRLHVSVDEHGEITVVSVM